MDIYYLIQSSVFYKEEFTMKMFRHLALLLVLFCKIHCHVIIEKNNKENDENDVETVIEETEVNDVEEGKMSSDQEASDVKGCWRPCNRMYSPVCASDGRTYGNLCVFKIALCKSKGKLTSKPGKCKAQCGDVSGSCNMRYCASDSKYHSWMIKNCKKTCGVCEVEEEKRCKKDYHKVGCFKRDLKLLTDLLITDLDTSHDNYTTDVDWSDLTASLESLACRCREKVIGHYKYFAIGFFGECIAGKDYLKLEKMFESETKVQREACIDGMWKSCDKGSQALCVGSDDYDYFYKLNEA